MNDSDQNIDQFLRVNEACKLLAVKRGTLYNLIKSGEVKRIKLMGATVFSKNQILRLMQSKSEAIS